jgi:hypothetical protein
MEQNPTDKDFKHYMLKAVSEAQKTAIVVSKDTETVPTITLRVFDNHSFTIQHTTKALDYLAARIRAMKSKPPQRPGTPKGDRSLKVNGVPPESPYRIEYVSKTAAAREIDGKPIGLIPVPKSPRTMNVPKQVLIKGKCPYITNGYYVIDESLITKKPAIDAERDREFTVKSVVDVVKKHFAEKGLVLVHEAGRNAQYDYKEALFTDGFVIRVFDAKYIDWLYKEVPNFSLRLNPNVEVSAAIVMSGNRKVGVLMPRRNKRLDDFKVVAITNGKKS